MKTTVPIDMIKGTQHKTKDGILTIIKYNSWNSVEVIFNKTSCKRTAEASKIRLGSVSDYNLPVVLNIGFIGNGKFKSKYKGRSCKIYSAWYHMFQRCYSDKYQKEKTSYIGCSVSKEWHDFQIFAEWFSSNLPDDGLDFHLDKDLKFIGNKIYSKETCMLVSPDVNVFSTDSAKSRGDLLIGVTRTKEGKFSSRCSNPINNSSEYLGVFNSEVKAHLAWRRMKLILCDQLLMTLSREPDLIGIKNYKEALLSNEIHSYK